VVADDVAGWLVLNHLNLGAHPFAFFGKDGRSTTVIIIGIP
jgi:hypothetical protein